MDRSNHQPQIITVMSICGVSSSGQTNPADLQASFKQQRADFQALATALQSGDVTTAQQAFAQLQKDSPRLAQAISSDPSSTDSPRVADLKSLASALQSGDLTGAQQAFAKLQTDVKTARHGHHHHQVAAAPASTDTSASSTGSSSSGTDSDGDNDNSQSVGTKINATA
jgi:DNA-binding FadR family transcriptional regulator